MHIYVASRYQKYSCMSPYCVPVVMCWLYLWQLQVELCRKVIRLYQDIAVSWVMDKDTWYVCICALCMEPILIKWGYLIVLCYTHHEREIVGGVRWTKLKAVCTMMFDFCHCREYMLAVILHVTLELLTGGPPDNRDSTLGGILANTLLKVLTYCYSLCPCLCPLILSLS